MGHARRMLAAAGSVMVVFGAVAGAADPAATCRATKMLRAGLYDACLLKAAARAARRGEAPDFTTCDAKLALAWAKAEARSGGSCPTANDAGTLAAQVKADVADVIAALTPSTTTTTTLPSPCGGALYPGCGGPCPAGQSCWASVTGPPTTQACACLPEVATPCADTGGSVSGATCGGACPAGEVCTTVRVDEALTATCGCIPAGATPCLGSGQPACGGACPAGQSCVADQLFPCVCM